MMRQNSLRPGAIGAMLCAAVLLVFADSAPAATPTVTYTDLYTLGTPAGFSTIDFNGNHHAAGGQIVGIGSGSGTANNNHALLWTPSATRGIDLNPSGFTFSQALGTSGSQQVGYGSATGTMSMRCSGVARLPAMLTSTHPASPLPPP